jgi:hypothetical protein
LDILLHVLAVVVILVCWYFGTLSLLAAVLTHLADPALNPERGDPKSSLLAPLVCLLIATLVGEWAFGSSSRVPYSDVVTWLAFGILIVTGVVRFVLVRLGYLRR